jgi:hypothetical protein
VYFAVTTNTVQFGALVDAFFGFDSVSVTGQLSFDALMQFSPFYFIIEMSASLSIKVGGTGVFSIRLRMALEGPTPWRAQGHGSISFFFFDVTVSFDHTWGEERDTALPPIEVMPILVGELQKDANWQALLPNSNNLLVSLRVRPPGETALVLHPVGTLRVSQRAVPLDLSITKVGNQAASDANYLSLSVAGGVLAKISDVSESFAPAQFRKLDDAAKLSKPAYEKEHGGLDLSVAGNPLASGAMVKRQLRYEVVTIDTAYKRFTTRFAAIAADLFAHFARGASVSRSALSAHEKSRLVPFTDIVGTKSEGYTVASEEDNRQHGPKSSFSSESSAQDYLSAELSRDPSLTGKLHVIPSYERAA